MPRTNYQQPASAEADRLIADLFALGGVGYVALGAGQEVLMRILPQVATDTTVESNFYEELLVNPTLLALAGQRGGLDCGGLRYIAIGYGGFIQLILPMRDGHVSLGIASDADAPELAAKARELLDRHDRAVRHPPPSLLAPGPAPGKP